LPIKLKNYLKHINFSNTMQEKNLQRIALITALIGIFIILIIAEKAEIPEIQIKDINDNLLHKEVKLKANITTLKYTPKILITTIQDNTGNITMIAYTNRTYIKKGQQIEIIGEIIEYKQQLEVEAKQIKII